MVAARPAAHPGCEFAQGFYFARPLDPSSIESLLAHGGVLSGDPRPRPGRDDRSNGSSRPADAHRGRPDSSRFRKAPTGTFVPLAWSGLPGDGRATNAAARSVVAVRSANSANPSKGGDAKPGIFREPVSQRPPGCQAPHIDVPEGGIDAAGGSSGGGSVPPTRTPADRGWSLDLTASRRIGATLTAVLYSRCLAPAASLAAGYDPASDANSMLNTTAYTGATAWWDAGYTGKGVDVALIDTGVTRVDGLDGTGKVVYGPDLSLESQSPDLRDLDTNGHGTFMAGLIAADSPAYRGMAPGARIVSVKVGVADGGTDVSQVIAAIDWVVQHRHDGDLNIRVINLSYGTNSAQDYRSIRSRTRQNEPGRRHRRRGRGRQLRLPEPHEQRAGSRRPGHRPLPPRGRLVGLEGTVLQADDKVPAFSPWPKRGATRGVDLIAPGTHIQGLRVPESYLDQNHPEGQLGTRYFRGSGTSESAAIVSGAAALILDKHPGASPNEVKKLLTSTAAGIVGKSQAIGGGELQLATTLTRP